MNGIDPPPPSKHAVAPPTKSKISFRSDYTDQTTTRRTFATKVRERGVAQRRRQPGRRRRRVPAAAALVDRQRHLRSDTRVTISRSSSVFDQADFGVVRRIALEQLLQRCACAASKPEQQKRDQTCVTSAHNAHRVASTLGGRRSESFTEVNGRRTLPALANDGMPARTKNQILSKRQRTSRPSPSMPVTARNGRQVLLSMSSIGSFVNFGVCLIRH